MFEFSRRLLTELKLPLKTERACHTNRLPKLEKDEKAAEKI
jgi:hypothetical protein